MKIKAVARLASEVKALTLLKGGSRQHIAVASAIYPLDGLPPVDEETILAMLDVPVGDRVDYQILTGPAAPFHDMLEDNLDQDLPAQLTDMLVSVSGETLRPLYSPLGLLCIREAERKPISDSAKTAAYFVRMVGNDPVVIVKNGFQCMRTVPESRTRLSARCRRHVSVNWTSRSCGMNRQRRKTCNRLSKSPCKRPFKHTSSHLCILPCKWRRRPPRLADRCRRPSSKANAWRRQNGLPGSCARLRRASRSMRYATMTATRSTSALPA